jgi:hypothetical protein
MAGAAAIVRLKEETLAAYSKYVENAEAGLAETLHPAGPYLWCESNAERAGKVREGRTIAQLWSGKHPVKVPDGLIHDWIGATRIPTATVNGVLAVVQDYDNHKNIYKPEVMDSHLLSRNGDDFEVLLRLLKKKIITVVLETYHDVHYSWLSSERCYCMSRTTRISEIENAGKPNERAAPPDAGYGFLWRLYSYWRFEQVDGAVYVECRAISLTRDVPAGLRWVIEPIVKKLPRESLIATLDRTRAAVERAAAGAAPDPGAA